MINQKPLTQSSDGPSLMASEFERIASLTKRNWGIHLEHSKRPLIQSRLKKRILKLGLSTFQEYCALLEKDGNAESSQFVSAITTNVTHFYRELHHFEHLEKKVLPDILTKATLGKRARIWSAGCSTGQEPYSLAGSVLACDPRASNYDLKILASDVDPSVLKVAQLGTYKPADTSFPKPDLKARIFREKVEADELQCVDPCLQALVAFRQLNLMAQWPFTGNFDVIMCRNVAIYFDKPTQIKLWKRFSESLLIGGYLYIGHSERISNPEDFNLIASGTTTYQRT